MNISKSVKTSNESLAETVNGAAEHAAESLGRAVDSARDRIDGVANTVTAAAHDDEHVAAADGEGEALHQRPAAERHGQVLDLDVRRPLVRGGDEVRCRAHSRPR